MLFRSVRNPCPRYLVQRSRLVQLQVTVAAGATLTVDGAAISGGNYVLNSLSKVALTGGAALVRVVQLSLRLDNLCASALIYQVATGSIGKTIFSGVGSVAINGDTTVSVIADFQAAAT